MLLAALNEHTPMSRWSGEHFVFDLLLTKYRHKLVIAKLRNTVVWYTQKLMAHLITVVPD